MKKIRHYLKGKRIALVGNAQSLFDASYGEIIEQHDVVCRINKGFTNITKSSEQYIGNRTDILFINLYKTMRSLISVYRMSSVLRDTRFVFQMNDTDDVPDKELKIRNEMLVNLKSELGSNPSTGMRCLYFLCSETMMHSCSVFGFDWKKTPSIYSQNKKDSSLSNHDFQREQEFTNNIFANDPRFNFYG